MKIEGERELWPEGVSAGTLHAPHLCSALAVDEGSAAPGTASSQAPESKMESDGCAWKLAQNLAKSEVRAQIEQFLLLSLPVLLCNEEYACKKVSLTLQSISRGNSC